MKKKKYRLLAVVMALLLVFGSAPMHTYASTTPAGSDVLAENNAGMTDKVTINNLLAGDVVKIYVTTYSPTEIPKVTGTVPTAGNSIVLSYAQLDPNDDGENIYITVTSTSSTESAPLLVALPAPGNSASIDPSQVTVNNNSGIPDNLEVINKAGGAVLTNGDIVKVYSGPSGNAIGVGYYSSTTGKVSVGLAQLLNPTAGGVLYVSLIEMGLKESARVEVSYNMEASSGVLTAPQITITNNAIIVDTVKVTGLAEGDTIKVYTTGTAPIGSGKAIKQSDGVTYAALISIAIAGTGSGTLDISLTNSGKLEGAKTTFSYAAAPKSDPLDPAYISIKNLSVLKDTITVSNIGAGDIIRAYRLGVTTPLSSSTVLAGKTEAIITIPQLGVDAGIIYVTYTKLGYTESDAVDKTYPEEEQSTAPLLTNIEVTNNFEMADTIKVSGLAAGDVVKLYQLATSETPFSSTTVATGKSNATATTAQIGATSGSIFVTVTSVGKLESDPAEKTFDPEVKSASPTDITISNNTGKADTVLVKGLVPTDKIIVYADATTPTPLGFAVVTNSNTMVSLSLIQLGVDAGSVYVSVKSVGKMESPRTKADYIAELITDSTGLTVTVKNYAGMPDVITVSGVTIGQLVKVYADATSLAPLVSTVAGKVSMDIPYSQLGSTPDDIWVSVTTTGSRESARVQKTYLAEVVSAAPLLADITVVNHTGMFDTIVVKATANASVFVYRDGTTKTPMVKGIVPPNGVLSLSYSNLGNLAGDIYVSVANKTESESPRTTVHYSDALISTAPIGGVPPISNVTTINNSGKADMITISNLLPGDIIRVYKDNNPLTKTTIAQAVFPSVGTSTNLSVIQLGQTAGSVYISVQSLDMMESPRTKIDFIAEKDSTPPVAGNVVVINNQGLDFILVSGLNSNDTVRVYSTGASPVLLSVTTVAPKNTYATFTLKQLGVGAGSVDITVTNTNCRESTKTNVTFSAE